MTTKHNQPHPHPYHTILKWVADGEEIQGLTTYDDWSDITAQDVFEHCNHFGDNFYFQPNELRIKPKLHIHQELMDAHKAGARIQHSAPEYQEWLDCISNDPMWNESTQYRIKPQPKPDIVGYCNVDHKESRICYPINFGNVTVNLLSSDNVKVTFCGETLKLKAIEIIKGNDNGTI